jgi:hypothetical protein
MILYVVIPDTQVTTAMINISLNNSLSTCRISTVNDTIFKFDSDDSLARETFINYEWLNIAGVKTELTNVKWDGGVI